MISNSDFITSMLNIDESCVEFFNVKTINEEVFFEITLKRKTVACPACGFAMIGHGHMTKKIKHPALREYKGTIIYHANRYICKRCQKTTFEDNPFSLEQQNSSYLMLRNVMRYLKNLKYTLKMISDELHISTTQVNKYLDSYITIPHRPLPECLGIDEIHSPGLAQRNSTYLCILANNSDRTMYDVLDSRNKRFLIDFFSAIPREERCHVKYVTIDMWEPYEDVVKIYLPNAIIAVDPFHVIEHLTKDFDAHRIRLMRQYDTGSSAYYLLKKWNYLLNGNQYLDNPKQFNRVFGTWLNKRDLYEMLLDNFPTLATAYGLKELYRRFNQLSYEEAIKRYDFILQSFKESNIREYDEFIGILVRWKEEILNSFIKPYGTYRLSNALTENINGDISEYITTSRGLTNFERFRKRLLYAYNDKLQYAITSRLKEFPKTGKKRGTYNKIQE